MAVTNTPVVPINRTARWFDVDGDACEQPVSANITDAEHEAYIRSFDGLIHPESGIVYTYTTDQEN